MALIVASAAQTAALHGLHARALQNGVTDVSLLTAAEAAARPDADADGTPEVVPAELTKDADDNVTIPNVTGVQYKKEGVNVNNGSVHNITVETDFTAVARAGFELAPGAPVAWTFDA